LKGKILSNKSKTPKLKDKMNKKVGFSLWYLFTALFLMYLFQSYFMQKHTLEIPYSQFKQLLSLDKVTTCTIVNDRIKGTLTVDDSLYQFLKVINSKKEANRLVLSEFEKNRENNNSGAPWQEDQFAELSTIYFETIRVDDPDLVNELQDHKVEFEGVIDTGWWKGLLIGWIFPLFIIAAIWIFVFRKMGSSSGGLMSIGKSKAKIYVEGKTKTTFKDVAGINEAIEEVKEIVEFLQKPDRFKKLGGTIPKGVLLVGSPGTGKTLLARAVAGEAGVPFLSMSGSDFVEMFVGVGAARVRDLFKQANDMAPCIIFVDELDALGKARGTNPLGGGHDEREQTLNQLLSEMDGFETNSGVIIMGATNRPEILDIALLRPGRFDRQVVVDRPDIIGREEILQVHAKKVKLAKKVDLKVVAARTPGFVGADLANIINEAALLAARNNKKSIEMEDLEESIDRVIAGLEKKSRVMNKKEKDIVAYHEAGHAIIAMSITGCDPVHRVSIIPRGVAALGYTLQLPTEDRYLMTRSELLARLKVLMGGRVAEEVTFEEVSTGAQNDLERATKIARSMVKEYGMNEKLGPINYSGEQRPLFLNQDGGTTTSGLYSERVASEIDNEVQTIISEVYEEVKLTLKKKKNVLKNLAKTLLEKEVVEKEELVEILNGIEETAS
jgi:cell division protease FtsH